MTSIDPIIDSSETQSIDDGSGVDRTITTRSIRKAVDSQPVVRQVVERRPVEAALQLAQASMKGCNSSIDPSTLSPNAALTRGWCLMELNRPIEAAAAFGAALLAAYAIDKAPDETLEDVLDSRVFAGTSRVTLAPEEEDVKGFSRWMEGYRLTLRTERAAVGAE